jgi:hypothetical protein
MSDDTSPGFGLTGFFLGIIVAGGTYFGVAKLAGASTSTAIIVLFVAAVIGVAYTAIAFSKSVYAVGFFSILGLVLDLSWSMLNTLAGFLVWIPACKIGKANFVTPDADSKRSGTFVYDSNPRGGGYDATTIGTCIAGGWSSHEENHVWQARIFGPTYLLAYSLSWILNILFRLITGKVKDISLEAYYRIPFEDWCYWGASTSGPDFQWGKWFLWFLLTLIYVGALIGIPVGIVLGIMPLWVLSIMVLVFYSLTRALAPSGH